MRVSRLLVVAFAMSPLSGCAHQLLVQAQSECSAFGFSAGTDDYASCVQQQYAAGQLRFQRGIANAQRGLAVMNSSYAAPTLRNSATGFLRRSYSSGMNRVCVYDQAGSDYVVTVGATEMCPLTAP